MATATKKETPVGNVNIRPVRVFPLDTQSPIKAFIDIAVADTFVIKGFRIIDGKNGLFVSMPQSKSRKDNRWYPDVYCETREINEDLQRTILVFYKNEVKSKE